MYTFAQFHILKLSYSKLALGNSDSVIMKYYLTLNLCHTQSGFYLYYVIDVVSVIPFSICLYGDIVESSSRYA